MPQVWLKVFQLNCGLDTVAESHNNYFFFAKFL